jgi:hypothetical protein
MGKFAKIIELAFDEQVLLTVNYDDVDDNYELVMRTDVEGVNISLKLVFKDEDSALNAMDSYNSINAYKFRNEVVVKFS